MPQKACFDPDGDGCYESYINTWPTDTVWYNGGGSVEESAYIYRGRMAAADMALRAGDDASSKTHLAEAAIIRRGMMKQLWDADRGHCGVYREQGGHQRLHTDAWLYSITLPVDTKMITPEPAADKNAAIVSLWDNWPNRVSVDVNQHGRAVWLLVAGSTNPMQTRIANATVRLEYADGVEETIDLVPPLNFWALSPCGNADYNPSRDGFALPATPPETLQLGKNCRAIVLNRRLRPDVALKKVTFEAMSQEVVIGLLGLTILR